MIQIYILTNWYQASFLQYVKKKNLIGKECLISFAEKKDPPVVAKYNCALYGRQALNYSAATKSFAVTTLGP